jgi:hypothetical protein
LKMDLTEGSETSTNINQTLGKHPKVNTVNDEISVCITERCLDQYKVSQLHIV